MVGFTISFSSLFKKDSLKSCFVVCILPAHYAGSRLKRAKMGAKLVPNGISPQKEERERGGQFMGGGMVWACLGRLRAMKAKIEEKVEGT